jgi:protein O-mannosyl-transferase
MRKRKPPVQQPSKPTRTPAILAVVAIAVAVLVIYGQTFSFGFISFDDGAYVARNAIVQSGLSLKNLAWAFSTFVTSNWHPLTWISFMLDCQLFGLDPGEQHAVNVLLHLASSILLFLALLRMTGRRWPSALVAAIFAAHPLHVESVAWIAERKDVLCTFFEILAIWFYARYAATSKPRDYALTIAAFALSLLAKPMAVTFPFLLMLIDLWPLNRYLRIVEKIPMFAMSAAASLVTLRAQGTTGATALVNLPFADRLGAAIVDYLRYIAKAFWPANLAMLYPIQKFSAPAVFASALILIAISAAAILTFGRRPYVLVGWLWFIGTLLPVVGLVQVGFQSIADRYSYVPLVGLSIAVIWTAADLFESKPRVLATAAAFIIPALMIAAYRQTGYWRDTITLYEHTLAATRDNYVIHNNLGIEFESAGRIDEAAAQFRAAVEAAPDFKDALNSLGAILEYKGDNSGAIALHRRAVAADPNYASAHLNLGHELYQAGQVAEARRELTEGLRLDPDSPRGHAYLGALLAATGDFDQARQHLERSAALAPPTADTETNLCYVLLRLGHPDQAIDACQAALKIRPNSANAQRILAGALAAAGRQ